MSPLRRIDPDGDDQRAQGPSGVCLVQLQTRESEAWTRITLLESPDSWQSRQRKEPRP